MEHQVPDLPQRNTTASGTEIQSEWDNHQGPLNLNTDGERSTRRVGPWASPFPFVHKRLTTVLGKNGPNNNVRRRHCSNCSQKIYIKT